MIGHRGVLLSAIRKEKGSQSTPYGYLSKGRKYFYLKVPSHKKSIVEVPKHLSVSVLQNFACDNN